MLAYWLYFYVFTWVGRWSKGKFRNSDEVLCTSIILQLLTPTIPSLRFLVDKYLVDWDSHLHFLIFEFFLSSSRTRSYFYCNFSKVFAGLMDPYRGSWRIRFWRGTTIISSNLGVWSKDQPGSFGNLGWNLLLFHRFWSNRRLICDGGLRLCPKGGKGSRVRVILLFSIFRRCG